MLDIKSVGIKEPDLPGGRVKLQAELLLSSSSHTVDHPPHRGLKQHLEYQIRLEMFMHVYGDLIPEVRKLQVLLSRLPDRDVMEARECCARLNNLLKAP